MREIRLIAACGAGLASASVFAQTIGPTPYTSFADSPFDGSGFAYFHLENYEDDALNTPGVLASSFTLGSSFGGLTDSVDADDGIIDGSGSAGESHWANGSITFTFDANALGMLPTHVGIVWTDGGGTINFSAYDLADNLIGSASGTHADGSFAGGTAEDRFYGIVHSGGVAKIVISNTSGGIEVDHLQYGAVPEPATMIGLGVGALALLRRKRRERT